MKSDQQKICHLISDAVTVMCKNGLDFQHDLKLEGVIGITLDNSDVFVVHINEAYNQHKELLQTPPMRTGAGDVEATTLTELPGLMWGMTRRGDKHEHHSARKRKIPSRPNKQPLSAAAASTVSVIPSSPENTSPTARDIIIEPRFEHSVDDDNITEPDLNTVRKLNVSDHNHEKVSSESVDLDMNQDNGSGMPLIDPSDIKTDNDYIEPHAKRAHLESCPVNIVNAEQPSTSDLNELTTDATVELLTDIKQEFSGDDISAFQLPQLENVEGATNWSQTQLDNSNEFTAGAATDATIRGDMPPSTSVAEELVCVFCPAVFSARADLNAHEKKEHPTNVENVCYICGKKYTHRTSLRAHKRNVHHGIAKHKCEFCGRTFLQVEDLEGHRNMHLGIKPFTCDLCNVSFTYRKGLAAHQRKNRHVYN